MPGTPAPGQGILQNATDNWYSWAYQTLQGIGAPTTPTNLQTLWKWSVKESGNGPMRWNNPLNTTQRVPGSVSKNSVGVQGYPDVSTGAAATTQTLLNGRYSSIVSMLRNSIPASNWAANPAVTSELGTWGSGANWLGWSNTPPKASTNFQGATGGSSQNTGNPLQDALNTALNPIGTAIGKAESNFVQAAANIGLMVFGGILMLAGLAVIAYGSVAAPARQMGKLAANFSPAGRAATAVSAAAPKPAAAPVKPQLSGEAQSALSEARAGRGRKLSPNVKQELKAS